MTTPDIIIPPEVLEAAAKAVLSAIMFEVEPDARANQLTNDEYRTIARAACLAMLKAWPGMHHYAPSAEPYYGKHIILPLPQEK